MGSQVDLDDLSPNEKDTESKPNTRGKSTTRSTARKNSARSEKDLAERLYGCFERIANALDERGDEELADILREDAGIMAQGLVSLTRPFTILRTPLLATIAVVEPVLAFGRVVRVAAYRWSDRRAEKHAEAAQAAQDAQMEAEAVT
jgi:hypothetical protein